MGKCLYMGNMGNMGIWENAFNFSKWDNFQSNKFNKIHMKKCFIQKIV